MVLPGQAPAMTPPDDGDDEWRFAVDDVGDDPETEPAEHGDGEGNVFGPSPEAGVDDIDPGSPDAEHVLFVALGVAVSVALLAALVGAI